MEPQEYPGPFCMEIGLNISHLQQITLGELQSISESRNFENSVDPDQSPNSIVTTDQDQGLHYLSSPA